MPRGVKNTLDLLACGAPRVSVARLLCVAGELLLSLSDDLISSYFVRGCMEGCMRGCIIRYFPAARSRRTPGRA